MTRMFRHAGLYRPPLRSARSFRVHDCQTSLFREQACVSQVKVTVFFLTAETACHGWLSKRVCSEECKLEAFENSQSESPLSRSGRPCRVSTMTLPSPALMELMSKVMDGDASLSELVDQIRIDGPHASLGNGSQIQQIAGATLDLGRQHRCGFGEVIYGEGKSVDLITKIIQTQLQAGQSALVTRIESGPAFQVRQSFQFAQHNPVAHTLRVAATDVSPAAPLSNQEASKVHHAAVVCAGSTDARVAEEAIETLAWMGVPFQRFDDIGVAGPQRLVAVVPQLRSASAVVVVAGMEGALPSVVAGHLSSPVFAVPTSVGYGAAFNGLTPLMGMLTSCTANVAVVNIDAGFKGGYMAGLVVDQLRSQSKRTSESISARQAASV